MPAFCLTLWRGSLLWSNKTLSWLQMSSLLIIHRGRSDDMADDRSMISCRGQYLLPVFRSNRLEHLDSSIRIQEVLCNWAEPDTNNFSMFPGPALYQRVLKVIHTCFHDL